MQAIVNTDFITHSSTTLPLRPTITKLKLVLFGTVTTQLNIGGIYYNTVVQGTFNLCSFFLFCFFLDTQRVILQMLIVLSSFVCKYNNNNNIRPDTLSAMLHFYYIQPVILCFLVAF